MENEFARELSEEEVKEHEEQVESFMQMLMKTKEIYNQCLQDYFNTAAVVRLIYIEHFKSMTKDVKSIDELKVIMDKELEMMKTKPDLTRIEKIEYRLARKIYYDVVEGKGLEYDIEKPLSYNYDGQIKEFEDIKMGFETFLKKNVD
jgi:hypothetical protein